MTKKANVTRGRVRPEGERADVAMRAGLDLLTLSYTHTYYSEGTEIKYKLKRK